jgi:CheY-like chemotaxis protein
MVANSVEEALNMATAEMPGIVITDIGMPDADGYELLSELRRLPEMEDVPAIAFSGYAMEEDYARALKAGFSAHLAKPLDPEKLLEVIEKLNP